MVARSRIDWNLGACAIKYSPRGETPKFKPERDDNWEFSVYSHFCAQILNVRGHRRSGSAEFCQRFDERLPRMAEAGDPIPKLGYGFSLEKPRG